jgi:hypothetical protein
MTLSISDTQHNNAFPWAECRYAECLILFTIMLSIIMLSVVMLNVGMLSVMEPVNYTEKNFMKSTTGPMLKNFLCP